MGTPLLRSAGLALLLGACSSSGPETGPKPVTADALLSAVPLATVEEDLVVNGVTIPAIELKRELVYRKGAALLESRKLDILIIEEIRRQVEANTSTEDEFELSPEELAAKEQEALDQIQVQYPELSVETVLGSNGMTEEMFRAQVQQTQLFDRVFLPENPDEWPQTTVDIMAESGGQALIDKLKESFEAREQLRLEAEESGEPLPADNAAGQAMWNTIMRKLVIQGLNKTTVVRTGADGLPPEQCMVVNGVEVSTDEMYEKVVALCSDEDFRRTRQWVAKTTAVEQALAAAEALISDEEFVTAFDAHEEPYKNSPFPLQVLAMGFKKFPSMDSYKRYYRLYESFQRMIEAELTDATLETHMPRANQMLGLALVDAEIILCAAKNMQTGQFEEGGWEAAAEEASSVVQKLVESEGSDWDALLDEHSDYWDAPTPQNAQQPLPQSNQKKNKGRFGALNRNEMVQRVGESDYDMFLLGSSVTDHVFFDQEVGTVDGPFRGPDGYYIARVKSRSNPTRANLSLADPNQRDLILQDYVACRFNQFAREIMEEATLEGM